LLSENSVSERSMTESDLKKSSLEPVDLSKLDVVIPTAIKKGVHEFISHKSEDEVTSTAKQCNGG